MDMRLLISLPDASMAHQIAAAMNLWDIRIEADAETAAHLAAGFDLWLLHECIPGAGGTAAGQLLCQLRPVVSPRVLFICPPEHPHPRWADCTAPAGASVLKLCQLLLILAQKPLPKLAAAFHAEAADEIDRFLVDIAFPPRLKGRTYAAWLIERMALSSALAHQPLQMLYQGCADAFHTSPVNVERCLRVAVESVFTSGSMEGIEKHFGATVDPERGKPTNRAFLLQAAERLRHSLTLTRSLNRREMHHSPAAPTSV